METLTLKIQKVISPIADWMSSNRYITSLAQGMQSMTPVILVGSFANLLANLGFEQYQAFLASIGIKAVFTTISRCTLSLTAVYASFIIAYRLGNEFEETDGVQTGLISLAAFLIVTPLGALESGALSIPLAWLGSAGYFTAIILGLLVPTIVKFFIKRNIYIKMPEGVPPIVVQSFAALVPAAFVFLVCSFGNFFLAKTDLLAVHQVVFALIQTPLKSIGTSFPAYLTVQIVGTLAFYCGIHYNTVSSVITPVLSIAALENQAAFAAGESLPHILSSAFNIYCQPGGVGGTLGLALAMVFTAKSERFKSLSKVCLIPSIFNINEPLIFGVPIMLNPILLIPYVLTPLCCICLSYFSTLLGLVARLPGISVGYTIPMVLSAFMSGGGVSGMVLQAVMVVISCLIWYPFFKILDKQALEEEVKS
jgi:PTS system, lactose/cellobiose family IIC component